MQYMKKTTKTFSTLQDAEAYANAMRSLPIHEEPVDADLQEAFNDAEKLHDLLSELSDED